MNSNQNSKDNLQNSPANKGNSQSANKGTSTQGGTHEQHVEAGRQSHKNSDAGNQSSAAGNSSARQSVSGQSGSGNSQSASKGTSTQGGTHEQHVEAGRQSHKNSK